MLSKPCLTASHATSSRSRVRASASDPGQPSRADKRILGLKEWAVNVRALHLGEQTILLRKGGLREPAFNLQAEEFFLVPNTFHSDSELLKPPAQQKYAEVLKQSVKVKESEELILDTWAKVTGVWTTDSLQTLQSLDELHIWNEEYVQNRVTWRSQQPVTVLELQCFRLPEAARVQNRPEIWGCFSFSELPDVPDGLMDMLEPVLAQDIFWDKQKALRACLCRSEAHAIFC